MEETVDQPVLYEDAGELKKKTKDDLIKIVLELSESVKKLIRKKEWGQQFDIWLIRGSKKGRSIDFYLSPQIAMGGLFGGIPGSVMMDSKISGIPKRIDQYHIQIDCGGKEVWVAKRFIVACHPTSAENEKVQ